MTTARVAVATDLVRPLLTPPITSNGYQSVAADLNNMLSVNAGPGDVVITLLSAVSAIDGATQIVTKADAALVDLAISGTANNGSGAIRLTLADTSSLTSGSLMRVTNVLGTTEANSTQANPRWQITVVDSTHVDLVGSTYTNAFATSYGAVLSGGRVVITDGVTDLAWLNQQSDIVTLRSNGAYWVAVSWEIQPIFDVFNYVNGTWIKPPLVRFVEATTISPGGPGGPGTRRATSTLRTGGAGGSGGFANREIIIAPRLSATESVTINAPSAGGVGSGTDTSNGAIATNVAIAAFGAHLKSQPAIVGPVGTTGAQTALTVGVLGNYGAPGAGALSGSAANPLQASMGVCGGGGAGGGATAANAVLTGSPGGTGSSFANAQLSGGSPGVNGTSSPGSGTSATDFTNHTGGAGGGGGGYATNAAGQDGAQGAFPGGGGGGGAASDNGFASGAGGRGGGGQVKVKSFF